MEREYIRLDTKLPKVVNDILEGLAEETGESKIEALKVSIKLRRKVHDLMKRPEIVLATKDEHGNLVEFAPLSFLE